MKIDIRTASERDMPQILNLSSRLFGDGYVKNIPEYIDSNEAVALVATEQESIVGFVLSKIYNHEEGHIKTIGVSSKKQGHRIGATLFERAESTLEQRGVKTIIVPAWTVNGNANISGLLKYFNYSSFHEDKKYWRKECESNIFHCPAKVGKYCSCSVEFYRKTL